MNDAGNLTRTEPVPAWMIRLAIYALGILGGGAVGTLLIVVNWCFLMQRDQSELKSTQAAMAVKQQDMIDALGSINRNLGTMNEQLAVLRAKP